jgi:glycosyltransferase involved in cell wall biosynthesis
MGPYWYDTLENSAFASWKSKIVRLDMAVDATLFPRLKKRFNPPGQRGFLYIGSNRPEKGCDVLSRTMGHMPESRCGWIGGGADIPGVHRLSSDRELTEDYMSGVAEDFDIFVNTSVSDANPTTILEAMAWGFPVACTPQSGYYKMPSLVPLSTSDVEGNARALQRLQYAEEAELRSLADANRRLIETTYTWERFCSTVWDHIAPYLQHGVRHGSSHP